MNGNWIDPVAFSIGSRQVQWYGVWLAAGFVAAIAHWNWLARRDGRPRGFGADYGFLVMITGILGARIAHVAANAPHYIKAPFEIIRVDQGGLIYYGGFLLAAFSVVVLARIRKESALSLLDFGMTGLALGHALGRIGCFFNGCCYGRATSLPWGVLTDGELRHPVQLYEAGFNLFLYALLTKIYLRKKTHGRVLALYLLLYGAWRFGIEFLRADERQIVLGLHAAQVVSLALMAAGVAFLWLKRRSGELENRG